MSNWFGSVSQAMDTLSYTIKAGGFTVLHRPMADDFSVSTRHVNFAYPVSSRKVRATKGRPSSC
jgi:hypothetical protein